MPRPRVCLFGRLLKKACERSSAIGKSEAGFVWGMDRLGRRRHARRSSVGEIRETIYKGRDRSLYQYPGVCHRQSWPFGPLRNWLAGRRLGGTLAVSPRVSRDRDASPDLCPSDAGRKSLGSGRNPAGISVAAGSRRTGRPLEGTKGNRLRRAHRWRRGARCRVAAICREHGVREIWSADRDFSRIMGLRVRNPLLASL